jgi:DegV family protein with EDD domain
MSKVAIVTDSTAHISSQHFAGLPISIIPLHIIWGEKSFRDGVDITPAEFFTRLKTEREFPHTSQIPLHDFVSHYRKLLEQGYEILSIHISERVSGTLATAREAARELAATDKIAFLDSRTGSAALAFQVIEAAKAALAGAPLAECLHTAEKIRDKVHTYFIPGALDSLYRGGRIGGAAAFLGSVLKILPILETKDGIIGAVERVRTMNRAMQRIIELCEERVKGCARISLVGLYADVPELADQLLTMLLEKISSERIAQVFTSTISPALGVHIGPGSVGLAFMICPD